MREQKNDPNTIPNYLILEADEQLRRRKKASSIAQRSLHGDHTLKRAMSEGGTPAKRNMTELQI